MTCLQHTAVLDTAGAVWTFGCNDEGSLGREVAEEEECFVPGKVELGGARVVMLRYIQSYHNGRLGLR